MLACSLGPHPAVIIHAKQIRDVSLLRAAVGRVVEQHLHLMPLSDTWRPGWRA